MQALGSLVILAGLKDFTLRNQSEVINVISEHPSQGRCHQCAPTIQTTTSCPPRSSQTYS